jgi:SAM-dependent methyltransferase
MDGTPNICAGPFGMVYDVYIERPWLMRAIGRIVWGIDASVLYTSIAPIGEARDVTILDMPCGGGVAFRALRPGQRVRYIAGDLCPEMLRRAERRAHKRSLNQVEFVEADMFLSFSGLHMVDEPERAVAEIARCLKPGGRLIGTAFFSDVSWRARTLFAIGARSGHPLPPSRDDLLRWLTDAGLSEPVIGPQRGFAAFSAQKGMA